MKKKLLLVIKIVVSLGLLGYLLSQLDWPALIDKLASLAWWTMPVAVALMLATIYIGTLRWAVLLRTHYPTFSTSLLFNHYLVATLFNNILPTSTSIQMNKFNSELTNAEKRYSDVAARLGIIDK